MNDESSTSLALAKQEFVSLLSRLAPAEGKDFLDWIVEQHSSLRSDDEISQDSQSSLSSVFQQCVNAEESLQSIIGDLRERLPLSGISASEMMLKPEVGQVDTH